MDSTEKEGCKIIKMRISTKRFDGHRGRLSNGQAEPNSQLHYISCFMAAIGRDIRGGALYYISDNFEISPCFCGLRVSDDKAEIGAWLTRL